MAGFALCEQVGWRSDSPGLIRFAQKTSLIGLQPPGAAHAIATLLGGRQLGEMVCSWVACYGICTKNTRAEPALIIIS